VSRVIDLRYRQYIASDAWKTKRRERLELDGHECTNCDATTYLEVHHLTYERLGNELMSDLQTLCQTCHARLHGQGPRVLPIVGSKTPRETKREGEQLNYHILLRFGGKLEEALENFVRAYGATRSERFDETADLLRWLAGDLIEEARRDLDRSSESGQRRVA
jgi:hypothetical protein